MIGRVVFLLVAVGLAGCIAEPLAEETQDDPFVDRNFDGNVVVAVIDSGFDPYHWDFLADHMPVHTDNDTSNDLPLDQAPDTWLLNYPDRSEFASFAPLNLTLTPDDPNAAPSQLYGGDSDWSKVQSSTEDNVHMTWIPGTKVVGYVNMGGGDGFATNSHGVGTTSVSVGNIHGSCPDCLLVFINGFSEEAVDWAANQDWIDLQTNSWGASTTLWDKVYTDCDNELHREAVERGHQIFFSGSNGQANAFVAPTFTLHSCQKGPDWLVTVGAISPTSDGSYTGHGKPVDISSLGSQYPSAGGSSVTADSTFSGTSNAAPVTAGMYAQGLYNVRQLLESDRMQVDGIIATGAAGCGELDPDCPLADGNLSVHEMRLALYEAASEPTGQWTVGLLNAEIPVSTQEMIYFSAGHGVYRAHFDNSWADEVERLTKTVTGGANREMSGAEIAFFRAASYCSQEVWGAWDHGEYDGTTPVVSAIDPLETWLYNGCPAMFAAIKTVSETV